MAKQFNIVKTAELKGELSKEQKRFNGFLQKIKNLKEQIELSRELALELGRMIQEEINPLENKMYDAWKSFILGLDRSMYAHNLTPKQQDKYDAIVFEQADSYLAVAKPDDEIKAIFDEHSEESFDDIQAEGIEEGKDYIVQMFKMQFGIDIDPDDIDDVQNPFNNPKLFEKIQEAKLKHDADAEINAQKKAETEANRPKTENQIKKEESRKAAESAVSKTTKQIYLDLVKNFHPDTEMDEEKKKWKTEIMQQVTVAYDEDDYIKLLELQMTLLENRENAVEKFDNKQLRHFNDALKQQVQELEMQLTMSLPTSNPTFTHGDLFNLNRDQMKRNVNRYVKDIQNDLNRYRDSLNYIQSLKGFKEYVKKYELDDNMDIDMGMLMEMMRFMK
jgi:hypothetical protein